MTDFKLVISDPKAKRAYQIEVKSPDADRFLGLKLGDKVHGETINLHGFEFHITGGSDKQGFPMRKDIIGTRRVKALLGHGVGLREAERGERRRRSVRGNQICEDTAQINMIVIKHGEKSLAAALGKEEKPKEGEVAKKEGSA